MDQFFREGALYPLQAFFFFVVEFPLQQFFVIGADMHKSGQFTVRTGSGLERESVHAADFAQAFFQRRCSV